MLLPDHLMTEIYLYDSTFVDVYDCLIKMIPHHALRISRYWRMECLSNSINADILDVLQTNITIDDTIDLLDYIKDDLFENNFDIIQQVKQKRRKSYFPTSLLSTPYKTIQPYFS